MQHSCYNGNFLTRDMWKCAEDKTEYEKENKIVFVLELKTTFLLILELVPTVILLRKHLLFLTEESMTYHLGNVSCSFSPVFFAEFSYYLTI